MVLMLLGMIVDWCHKSSNDFSVIIVIFDVNLGFTVIYNQ